MYKAFLVFSKSKLHDWVRYIVKLSKNKGHRERVCGFCESKWTQTKRNETATFLIELPGHGS